MPSTICSVMTHFALRTRMISCSPFSGMKPRVEERLEELRGVEAGTAEREDRCRLPGVRVLLLLLPLLLRGMWLADRLWRPSLLDECGTAFTASSRRLELRWCTAASTERPRRCRRRFDRWRGEVTKAMLLALAVLSRRLGSPPSSDVTAVSTVE